jgi:hypothetical protein
MPAYYALCLWAFDSPEIEVFPLLVRLYIVTSETTKSNISKITFLGNLIL